MRTKAKTTMVSSAFFSQSMVSLLFVACGFLALKADANAVCERGEFCPNSTLSDCTSCFDCPVSCHMTVLEIVVLTLGTPFLPYGVAGREVHRCSQHNSFL